MSHENSETVEVDGRWVNIGGPDRKPLTPAYDFEQPSYDTLAQAESAARRRSALGGGPGGTAMEDLDRLFGQGGGGTATATAPPKVDALADLDRLFGPTPGQAAPEGSGIPQPTPLFSPLPAGRPAMEAFTPRRPVTEAPPPETAVAAAPTVPGPAPVASNATAPPQSPLVPPGYLVPMTLDPSQTALGRRGAVQHAATLPPTGGPVPVELDAGRVASPQPGTTVPLERPSALPDVQALRQAGVLPTDPYSRAAIRGLMSSTPVQAMRAAARQRGDAITTGMLDAQIANSAVQPEEHPDLLAWSLETLMSYAPEAPLFLAAGAGARAATEALSQGPGLLSQPLRQVMWTALDRGLPLEAAEELTRTAVRRAGETVARRMAESAGTFAPVDFLREVATELGSGQPVDVRQASQAAVRGAMTGGALGVAGRVAEAGRPLTEALPGGRALQKGLEVGAEGLGFGAAGAAAEGRLPTAEDLVKGAQVAALFRVPAAGRAIGERFRERQANAEEFRGQWRDLLEGKANLIWPFNAPDFTGQQINELRGAGIRRTRLQTGDVLLHKAEVAEPARVEPSPAAPEPQPARAEAPAYFLGWQDDGKGGHWPMYVLTRDVEGVGAAGSQTDGDSLSVAGLIPPRPTIPEPAPGQSARAPSFQGRESIPPPRPLDLEAQAPEAPRPLDLEAQAPAVDSFVTAKGSVYTILEDGRTRRIKAPRPEHPGDAGPQTPSEQTWYVTPENANRLGEIQAMGARRALMARPDGTIGLMYVEGLGPQGTLSGRFEARTVVRPEPGPAVGLIPVEVWQGGRVVHFGNPITEVRNRPQESAQEPAQGVPQGADVAPGREAPPSPAQEPGPGVEAPARPGSASQPPESGQVREPRARPPARPPYELNLDELEAAYEDARQRELEDEVAVFGQEGAAEYRRLLRLETSMDHRVADEASAQRAQMEDGLSEDQRRRLFGIGDSRPSADDYREFQRALEGIDVSSPQAMGASLRWAVTHVGQGSDPAKMTPAEQRAYAQIRYANEVIRENGWESREVSQAAFRAAADRFSDPADAEFMLRRFARGGTPEAAAEPPALSAPLEPQAPAVSRGTPAGGEVRRLPLDDLHLDPDRFQYKVERRRGALGSTGSLEGVRRWDENLAGTVLVWLDPADGRTYVINGHNRVAYARKLQEAGDPSAPDSVAVKYLEGIESPQAARAAGALANIAEGRGTIIDAARFFRDSGADRETLAQAGMPLTESTVNQGLALAALAPPLFQRVVRGELSVPRAVIIGERVVDHEHQMRLLDLISRHRARPLSDRAVAELADTVAAAPKRDASQDQGQVRLPGIGDDAKSESLALERARLLAAIRARLATDKRLFGAVSRSRASARLAEEGNVIQIERSQAVSREAAELLAVFDILKNRVGPVADLLNRATERIAERKEKADAVLAETYAELRKQLPAALRRGVEAGGEGLPPGQEPQSAGARGAPASLQAAGPEGAEPPESAQAVGDISGGAAGAPRRPRAPQTGDLFAAPAAGVEGARAIGPDAIGSEHTLQTPGGKAIARLRLVSGDPTGRGSATYEVLAWTGADSPLPEWWPKGQGSAKSYVDYFRGRLDQELRWTKTNEVSRRSSALGFLQTSAGDARYLRPGPPSERSPEAPRAAEPAPRPVAPHEELGHAEVRLSPREVAALDSALTGAPQELKSRLAAARPERTRMVSGPEVLRDLETLAASLSDAADRQRVRAAITKGTRQTQAAWIRRYEQDAATVRGLAARLRQAASPPPLFAAPQEPVKLPSVMAEAIKETPGSARQREQYQELAAKRQAEDEAARRAMFDTYRAGLEANLFVPADYRAARPGDVLRLFTEAHPGGQLTEIVERNDQGELYGRPVGTTEPPAFLGDRPLLARDIVGGRHQEGGLIFERTQEGLQAVVPGAERREAPAGPIRKGSSKPALESGRAELNLFNREAKAAYDAQAGEQPSLFIGGGATGAPSAPAEAGPRQRGAGGRYEAPLPPSPAAGVELAQPPFFKAEGELPLQEPGLAPGWRLVEPDAAAKYAGSINLQRLDTTPDVKRLLQRVEQEHGGFTGQRRRGHISLEETERLAREAGLSEDKIRRRVLGGIWNAEQITQARGYLLASAQRLEGIIRQYREFQAAGDVPAGSPGWTEHRAKEAELLARLAEVATHHVALQAEVEGASTEIGRALSAHRILAKATGNTRLRSEAVKQAVLTFGGEGRVKELADLLTTLPEGDVAGMNRFLQKAASPKWWDKLYEAWLSSILSGPSTHLANTIGNTMFALVQAPERALAAGVDAAISAVTGRPRQTFLSEAAYDTFGMFMALGPRGIGQAVHAYLGAGGGRGRTSALSLGAEAFLNERGGGRTKVETQPAIGGRFGKIVRIPLRALTAEDVVFKAIAWNGSLYAGAARLAAREGLRPGTEAWSRRLVELVDDPTVGMLHRAEHDADYRTFNQKLGPWGQRLLALRHQGVLGQVTRYILPFVRTPANIAKATLERTPLGFINVARKARAGVYRPPEQPELAPTVPVTLAEDLAKPLFGSLLMAAVGWLAAQGYVTGSGPADPRKAALLKETGWQPYSAKLGRYYIAYNRLEPVGSLLGIAADVVETVRDGHEAKAGEMLERAHTSLARNLTDKTFLAGLSSLARAYQDPRRFAETWIEQQAASLVPAGGLLGAVARGLDTTERDVEGPLAAMASRLPFLRNTLPARVGALGDIPVTAAEPGISRAISPLRIGAEREGRLAERELLAAGVTVGHPGRTLKVGQDTVELTRGQYRTYQAEIGRAERAAVERLVSQARYARLSAQERHDALEHAIDGARREVRERFRRELATASGGAR